MAAGSGLRSWLIASFDCSHLLGAQMRRTECMQQQINKCCALTDSLCTGGCFWQQTSIHLGHWIGKFQQARSVAELLPCMRSGTWSRFTRQACCSLGRNRWPLVKARPTATRASFTYPPILNLLTHNPRPVPVPSLPPLALWMRAAAIPMLWMDWRSACQHRGRPLQSRRSLLPTLSSETNDGEHQPLPSMHDPSKHHDRQIKQRSVLPRPWHECRVIELDLRSGDKAGSFAAARRPDLSTSSSPSPIDKVVVPTLFSSDLAFLEHSSIE